MARKHDIDDINLEVTDVHFFYNEETKLSGVVIAWQGSIGWGEYTIYKDTDGSLRADSECMDRGEDKDFGRALMQALIDKCRVTG